MIDATKKDKRAALRGLRKTLAWFSTKDHWIQGHLVASYHPNAPTCLVGGLYYRANMTADGRWIACQAMGFSGEFDAIGFNDTTGRTFRAIQNRIRRGIKTLEAELAPAE